MAGDNPPLTVPGVSNSVFGRYTRTVLVGVALLGAAFIFVGVRTAPSLSWLSKNGGINWIIYPAPPDLVQRPSCELSTVFKRSLTLNEVPREARLRVAGLRRWAVVVNRAQARSKTAGTTPNQPAEFTITNLHQGENTILVTVSNSNGPPALWLSLEAGDVRLSSDESWEASYAGAAWRPARLADKPPVVPAGNAVFGGAAAYDALRERLLLLLVCVIVTGGITLVHFRLRSRKATMDSNVGDPSAWRVLVATHWPLLLAIILWSALIVNNLAALPPLVGFDVNEHVQFIRFIQEHNALPPPGEGWELFQPPLYYILSAMLLKVCGLSVSTSAGVAVLRLFGLVVGIAHLALIWVALRLLFPADRARQIAGLCVAASLAPLIYLSQYVTNEGLAAMLATACLFLGLRIFRNSQPSWLAFVGLGACLGAALLTKLTAILLLPSVLGAFLLNAPNLWPALVSPNNPAPTRPARIGLQLAIMSAACFTVCGWHYYRVYQQFGNPLVGAWIPASGFSWWQ
ncbi:MAG TPA: glycosyltransferase family 39 protein, partial [Candidatus Dormibacteraeota bacterium]|nr:glycosyltransferase family 39 protein [Candidatus Dormibacteraeota bacterium]